LILPGERKRVEQAEHPATLQFEQPRRVVDPQLTGLRGDTMRLQMARRQIDNEVFNFSATHRFELGRHDLDMRRKVEYVTWVQLIETAFDETGEIVLQNAGVFLR
jgi:hypothetical protein